MAQAADAMFQLLTLANPGSRMLEFGVNSALPVVKGPPDKALRDIVEDLIDMAESDGSDE